MRRAESTVNAELKSSAPCNGNFTVPSHSIYMSSLWFRNRVCNKINSCRDGTMLKRIFSLAFTSPQTQFMRLEATSLNVLLSVLQFSVCFTS